MEQTEYVQAIYTYANTFLQKIVSKYKNCEETADTNKQYEEEFPVWVFWWQGFDNAPEVIKVCVNSMKKNLPDNAVIHMLDKDNFGKYIQLPDIVFQRFNEGVLDIVHFSDVLRVNLLRQYGGLWIDSTIFVAKKLNSDYFDKLFFSQNYGELDLPNDVARGRWGTYLLGAHKNLVLFSFLCDAWQFYLERHNVILDYYLLDYFIAVAYNNIPVVHDEIVSCAPNNMHIHDIQDLYSAGEFDAKWHEELTNDTQLFKLTYKYVRPKMTEDGKETLYGWICRMYGE